MKFLLFVSLVLGSKQCKAPRQSGQIIPDHYLITFNKSNVKDFQEKISCVTDFIKDISNKSNTTDNYIIHQFDNVIYGISAKLDKDTIELVKKLPDIVSVEPDRVVKVENDKPVENDKVEVDPPVSNYANQTNAPWNLARISQRPKLTNPPFTFHYHKNGGEGVSIYVLDTGINVNNTEFGGRASWGTTTVKDSRDSDLVGHGSHCAGVAAGTTYGVAKNAKVIAVKVLDDEGYGSTSSVVAGVNWAVKNKSGSKGNILSMSLGVDASDLIDKAVEEAIAAGIVVVASAGNDNKDACAFSPSRIPSVITVGATDINDTKPDYSNFGKCVKLLAPGSNVKSSWMGRPTSVYTMSGTSMACPHVSGIAATLLSAGTPAKDVFGKLKSFATKLENTGFNADTTNLLAFNGYNESQ